MGCGDVKTNIGSGLPTDSALWVKTNPESVVFLLRVLQVDNWDLVMLTWSNVFVMPYQTRAIQTCS